MRSVGIAPKNGKQIVGLSSQQFSSTPVGFGKTFLSKEQCHITVASPILS